jgi:hypothetical protein
MPENANREAANPRGCWVLPISRFENEGGPEVSPEIHHANDAKSGPIGEHLPALLDAVAALLTPEEGQEMRDLARTEPDKVAELCRLILAAPPFPSEQDAAELDALIVRLCELEPWLAGYQAEMLAARRDMAPVNYAEELAKFRGWVREAEARQGRGPDGAGAGNPSAP